MEGSSNKIVSFGALVMDLISYGSRFPKPGETFTGHKFESGYGGKGGNGCVAAARLGAATYMVGKVGGDYFGRGYLKSLKENGVNSDYVSVAKDMHTSMANIIVADDGQNSIMYVPGATGLLTVEEIENAGRALEGAKIFHCTFECSMDFIVKLLSTAKKHSVTTVVNAAPIASNIDADVYTLTDVLCVNETEAEFYSGITISTEENLKEAIKVFLKKGCKKVIVTMGEAGAIYGSLGEDFVRISAKSVSPVDTTGAGDAFVGGLIYYLAEHKELPFKEIVQRSCDIATISVQTAGTQLSYPRKKDLPCDLFL